MKIALLTPIGEENGIAPFAAALTSSLCGLPDTEVEVIPIERGRQPTSHYLEQAARYNAVDVDVVHIQHDYALWGGILPRQSAFWEMRYLIKKPVVLTAHNLQSLEELFAVNRDRAPHRLLQKRLLVRNEDYRQEIEIAPFSTAITIVPTAAARNELIARGGKPGYVYIVPNGVPAPLPAQEQGQNFRVAHGLETRRIITHFGAVAPGKGIERTLEILPGLPNDVTLVIAGAVPMGQEGGYEMLMRLRVQRMGLEARVVWTGAVAETELGELMAATDIVVAPAERGVSQYSVGIALAQGRPILASDLAYFREISGRVDCLELFKAGDSQEYSVRLLALLENNARRMTLEQNARKYALRFAWPRVAEMTRKVYNSAMDVFHSGPHHGMGLPVLPSTPAG